MILTLLKIAGQLHGRPHLSLTLSGVSSRLDSGFAFSTGISQKWCWGCSPCSLSGGVIFFFSPLPLKFSLRPWFRRCLPLLHCQVILFLLVINMNFRREETLNILILIKLNLLIYITISYFICWVIICFYFLIDLDSQCRRYRRWEFDSWVGKIPWRREWQPTPVFLPGKSHRQRSLAGYSPWGCKESDLTEWLRRHAFLEHF